LRQGNLPGRWSGRFASSCYELFAHCTFCRCAILSFLPNCHARIGSPAQRSARAGAQSKFSSASAGQWPASLAIRLPSPTARSPIAAVPWCAGTSTTPTTISNLKPHSAAQGCSNVGPGRSKPEIRRPKAERNPKAEVRIDSHPGGAAASRLRPFSEFGFRPSFGLRPSAFGFQGCRT